LTSPYPDRPAARDQWILSRRAARAPRDITKPHAAFLEDERTEDGTIARGLTILLVNRECPWRCLMCDLWRFTTSETVPSGAIPAQIDEALRQLRLGEPLTNPEQDAAPGLGQGVPPLWQVKLYNAGSFFDRRAIPPEDHAAIARRVRAFSRVIVESHPALVGDRCLRFRDLLAEGAAPDPRAPTRLEVALGLETANPGVLEKLNKRMTLDQFRRAADFLRACGIDLRVFVLVRPPFLDEAAALHWAQRSIDLAFDCGATVVSLIPVRPGNGALEALAALNLFAPPQLATVETVADYGVSLGRGRVFVDLWDLQRFSSCAVCFEARRARIEDQNLRQGVAPRVICPSCGSA
jgi:archaeosine synthase beta-subunit